MTTRARGRYAPIKYPPEKILGALAANEGNQRLAALELGVSTSWVTKWLKTNGYQMKVEWVKKESEAK